MIITPKGNRSARLKALHSLLDMLENDQQFLAAKTLSRKDRPHLGVPGGIAKLYAQLLVSSLIRSLHSQRRVPQSIKRARALGILVYANEPAPKRERKRLPKPSPVMRARQKLDRLAGRRWPDDGEYDALV